MKLHFAPVSPYVRKVVVTAIEAGLDDEIERISPSVRVWVGDGDSGVNNVNPLGKIPTLITRDGTTLIDSSLICEYLASLVPSAGLLPSAGNARWQVLQLQALAQGAMDAVVSKFVEQHLRPDHLCWNDWVARQELKASRTFDRLETMARDYCFGLATVESVNLGTITVGCTLGFLDQRLSDQRWRAGRPTLAAWYEDFRQRPSMLATVPPPLV
jgi:glutathione S-transferase